MTINNLQLDAATMRAGRLAFVSLAQAGSDYGTVYAALRSAGVHGNATHGFIERLERDTGRRLGGDRPAGAGAGAAKTSAVGDAIAAQYRLRGAKRDLMPGKTKSTGTKVQPCPKCGAPVVDSQRAREGHTRRTGCAG